MQIKQDPVTKLWCREDGAVLMPPIGYRFKKFRWTFGCKQPDGYRAIRLHGKQHQVHQLICRTFNGLPPADKPFVDHINRIKDVNYPSNLHWVSNKENNNNKDRIDRSVEKYGVRECDDKAAYGKAYGKAYRAEKKARGLTMRKGPDGKYGWFPFKRAKKEASNGNGDQTRSSN